MAIFFSDNRALASRLSLSLDVLRRDHHKVFNPKT